jgi:hypothetical protein
MVGHFFVAILAAVVIPFYVSYVQEAIVVAIIIPRSHLIESNICYFCVLHNGSPGSSDTAEILAGIDMSNLDINLTLALSH